MPPVHIIIFLNSMKTFLRSNETSNRFRITVVFTVVDERGGLAHTDFYSLVRIGEEM